MPGGLCESGPPSQQPVGVPASASSLASGPREVPPPGEASARACPALSALRLCPSEPRGARSRRGSSGGDLGAGDLPGARGRHGGWKAAF